MADQRRYELDELLIRPGTYFNPQTEVMVVVDDSPSIDAEIFNMEQFEGADWVLIADDLPVDDAQRDEFFERFQATYHGERASDPVVVDDDPELGGLDDDDDPELDPDPDPEAEAEAEEVPEEA